MTFLKVVQSGLATCQDIIDTDLKILQTATCPTLHFGRFNQSCLTYGKDMILEDHVDAVELEKNKIHAVRRHTPGGAIFHCWDLVFSFVCPFHCMPQIQNVPKEYISFYTFKFVNNLVLNAIKNFIPVADFDFISEEFLEKRSQSVQPFEIPFCMGKPTRFDILHQNKKIVGGAETFLQGNFLHNGTVSICKPDEDILRKVLKNPKITDKMLENSFYISNFHYTDKVSLNLIQSKIEYQIFKTFEQYFQTIDNLVS